MSRIYPIDVNEYPRLNPEQEKELLSQLKYSDCTEKKQEARDALVYHNMGLIYSVINKVCSKSQNNAEMVSYGVEGFLIALDKYDINSNAKLTTYAYNWVFKKVVEGNRADHIIQFPENVWDGIAKYTRAVEAFKKDNEINPTNRPFSDECADGFVSDMERALVVNGDMSLSVYKLVVVAIEKLNVESYDQTVGTDSQNKQMTLDDVIEDKKASSNNRQNELQLALKTEFEKMCIEMGNKGNDVVEIFNLKLQGLASAEIQRKLGMTRSVERSLEKKGMEFLRNSSTLQLLVSEMC